MNRAGDLFDPILDRENLRIAFCKAMRGKRARRDAREFARNVEPNLRKMAAQVRAGTFPLGRSHEFVIHDPKQRTITAPVFAERVLHHAIMNVCEPIFERGLIHDTYACRVGRGRVAAVERTRWFASRFRAFLKMDVRKYFESIDHDVLIELLHRRFKDPQLLDLFDRIVRSKPSETNRGLPIGSLTSQHFANFYLSWFDRFVKEHLRMRGYVRYMDDMMIWGDSTRELQGTLDACREFLATHLALKLKEHPYVNRTNHGVDFLGCRIFPDHVILSRRSRVRFRRKMVRLEEDFLERRIDEYQLQDRATALIAFTQAAGAKSWHFRTRVLQELPVSGRRPRTG